MSATLDLALYDSPAPLRVLSAHQHAINLVTPTNTVFAFVTPHHGHGPFHVVISPTLLAQCQRQPALYLRDHTVQAGAIIVPLAKFTRWNPHLPALQVDPSHGFDILYRRYHQRGQPALGLVNLATATQSTTAAMPSLMPALVDGTTQYYYQRAQQATELLSQGLSASNTQLIADGATLLAGLGPGLTPAGDDFLVGLLAAFYALGPHCAQRQWPAWQAYTGVIAHTANRYTTQLSAAWLTHAGAGAFGEAWHHLLYALNANQPQAITACADRILATGATSGADALGGFLWALAVLGRTGK